MLSLELVHSAFMVLVWSNGSLKVDDTLGGDGSLFDSGAIAWNGSLSLAGAYHTRWLMLGHIHANSHTLRGSNVPRM
jgi:hypothetical protein